MSVNLASFMNMALGAATTAAFCFEKKGPFLAAGLAVVNVAMELIFGVSAKDPDPRTHFVTRNDLSAALKNLEADFDDKLWNAKLDSQVNLIKTLQDSFNDAFDDMINDRGMGPTTSYIDIARNSAWQKYYNGIFDTVYQDDTPLKRAIADLSDPKNTYRFKSVSLYASAVGLFINYCQLGLWIDFARLINNQNANVSSGQGSSTASQNTTASGSSAKSPKQSNTPALPDNYLYLVDYPSAIQINHMLIREIPILTAMVVQLEGNYKELETALGNRKSQLVVLQKNGNDWGYKDIRNGSWHGGFSSSMSANLATDVVFQQEKQSIIDTIVAKHPEMTDVSLEDTKNLRKIVGQWSKTISDYNDRKAELNRRATTAPSISS